MYSLTKYFKKINLIDYVFIISLILFVLISLHLIIKAKKRNGLFIEELNFLNIEKKNIKENFFIQIKTNGFEIDTGTIMYDEVGNALTFNKLISPQPKLVVRYTPNMCGSCFEYVMKVLKEMEKGINPDNIFIFSCFETFIPIKIFKQTYSLQYKVYNITRPIINFPLEKLKIPALFILINNKVENIFILDDKFEEFNNEFLSLIKQKYF
jgi:hypothetical protein